MQYVQDPYHQSHTSPSDFPPTAKVLHAQIHYFGPNLEDLTTDKSPPLPDYPSLRFDISCGNIEIH